MSHFVKGQGLVRTSFKSNVELRSANLDFVAGKYIVNPRAGFAEGLSSVTVNDESIGKALITNPASLTEVHLPTEYTAIGPKAFDGCANLTGIYVYAGQVIPISEDAIPNGCAVYVDYEFVTEYQTLHPTLDIRGFDSGYVWEVPYVEGVTPNTLTAQYINDCVEAMGDAKDNVGKVVVPLYFTAYESGALDALFTQLTNLEEIESPWLNGNVEEGLTLNILGSGTLTAQIVSEQIEKFGNEVINNAGKLLIPSTFTNYVLGALDVCDNYFADDQIELICDMDAPINSWESDRHLYSWNVDGKTKCSIRRVVYNGTKTNFFGDYNKYVYKFLNDNVTDIAGFFDNRVTEYSANKATKLNGRNYKLDGIKTLYVPNVTQYIGPNYYPEGSSCKIFAPKLSSIGATYRASVGKTFIGTDSCSVGGVFYGTGKFYFKANVLMNYIGDSIWGTQQLIGVIDGSGLYNGMHDNTTSMNYPTLTGIDTASNIQALTPADGSLYLASNTGDLWKYENSAWSNLFSGYTATWYSDEDCTTTVSSSAISTTDTVYVKLTAI